MDGLLTPIELLRPPTVEFGPGTASAVGRWAEAEASGAPSSSPAPDGMDRRVRH